MTALEGFKRRLLVLEARREADSWEDRLAEARRALYEAIQRVQAMTAEELAARPRVDPTTFTGAQRALYERLERLLMENAANEAP